MHTSLVALDLETTGLKAESDAIIEIGAARLVNGVIVEEFSTLINPNFALSPEITYITGIRQEDLRGKPALHEVLPQIIDFVGTSTVIAHNVGFDLAFMRRAGALKSNLSIDTLELSTILLPRMPRYGLGGLAALLGIPMLEEHRAMADARATALLYWKLWEHALCLPTSLLLEIAAAGKALDWELATFFAEAAQDVQHRPAPLRHLHPYVATDIPLVLSDTVSPVDSSVASQALEADSAFARLLPQYERRPEQLAMTEAIADALNQQQQLIVEAGTGTGKSLAYLVPAALYAAQNRQRIVIATNTINLQDQLITKDIPLVKQAVQSSFNAAVLKGRVNYICPRRLEAVRRRQPGSLDELRVLTKVLVWLQDSQTGDRSEITLRTNEISLWNRLSAEDEGCTTQQCEAIMQGVCPFYKAHKSAEASELVIVNHALLAADAMADNRILPEYHYLIVDEAHQLEEAVTGNQTLRIDQMMILRRVQDLGDTQKGLLGDLLRQVQTAVQEKQRIRLQDFALGIGAAAKQMSSVVRSFFLAIREWIADLRSDYNGPLRITARERQSAAFLSVQALGNQLYEYLDTLSDAMTNLTDYLDRLSGLAIPTLNELIYSASATAIFFAQTRARLYEFTHETVVSSVYWIDIAYNADFNAIQIAPLSVGNLLDERIWTRKRAIILTSATLEANESFEFIQQRLQMPSARTLKIGSPFDYERSTLLFMPTDMPEPNRPHYQQTLERGIIELATALEGRLLVLFTSYNHLRETVSSVGPRLALGNITIYDQAVGGSRETLLDGYRNTPRSVLMGTRSFWQGVDLPGNELLGLIIVKLPFAVPSDPVFAARAEQYDNAFDEYTVPDAVLRFRQGFGRLIRSSRDRGIVAVFDSRVTRKKYGSQFLNALPTCTVTQDTTASLGDHARRWLAISQ